MRLISSPLKPGLALAIIVAVVLGGFATMLSGYWIGTLSTRDCAVCLLVYLSCFLPFNWSRTMGRKGRAKISDLFIMTCSAVLCLYALPFVLHI